MKRGLMMRMKEIVMQCFEERGKMISFPALKAIAVCYDVRIA